MDRSRLALPWVLIATVYYLAARLGLSLAFEHAQISPVWPPTGVAIAAVLYLGLRAWPGIFAGALVANMATGLTLLPLLGIASGNTLEALTAGYLILRFVDRYPFRQVRHVVLFTAIVMAATSISASVGVGSLLLAGAANQQTVALLWGTWWLGDTVGCLVLTPFLLTWVRRPGSGLNSEMLALTICTMACAALVFGSWFYVGHNNSPLSFVILPPLIWASFRFRQHGATLLMVALSGIAIIATLHGLGPFAHGSANESLLLLQGFMGMVAVTALTLAAAVDERRLSYKRLKEIRLQLEQLVAQRTSALQVSNAALEAEIDQRDQTERALRALLAANTVDTDEEFFHSCVASLCKLYGTAFAFVGVFSDDSETSIQTLAVRAGNDFADNFKYDLEGTPCQDVLNMDMELIPQDAARLYPQDELLGQMGVDSYFGAPLISPSNQLMGLVAVMDTHPLSLQHWTRPVLGIFANLLAHEIERRNTANELKLAASVFNENVEAIMITDRDARIQRVNPAFSRITGFSADEAIGQPTRILNSGRQDSEYYAKFWQQLLTDSVWQGEMWTQRGKSSGLSVFSAISRKRSCPRSTSTTWHTTTHSPACLTGLHSTTISAMPCCARNDMTISLHYCSLTWTISR